MGMDPPKPMYPGLLNLCCCMKQPTCIIDVKFEKASYIIGEHISALVSIDNSKCNKEICGFALKLIRNTSVRNDLNP